MWCEPRFPPVIRTTRENGGRGVQPTTSNSPLTGQSVDGSGCRLGTMCFFLPGVVRVCALWKTVVLCLSPLSVGGESPKMCAPLAHSKGELVWGARGGGGNAAMQQNAATRRRKETRKSTTCTRNSLSQTVTGWWLSTLSGRGRWHKEVGRWGLWI